MDNGVTFKIKDIKNNTHEIEATLYDTIEVIKFIFAQIADTPVDQ